MTFDHKTILTLMGRAMESNPSPDEKTIRQAAKDYLLSHLDELTGLVQAEYDQTVEYQKRALERESRRYWVFLQPLDPKAKPEIVYEDSEVVTVRDPQRQPIKVRRRDLAAFAKERKLDAKEMERVGNGEQESHRGYHRKPGLGDMLLGREYQVPTPQDEPTPPNKRAVRREFQFAAPVVDWTPSK